MIVCLSVFSARNASPSCFCPPLLVFVFLFLHLISWQSRQTVHSFNRCIYFSFLFLSLFSLISWQSNRLLIRQIGHSLSTTSSPNSLPLPLVLDLLKQVDINSCFSLSLSFFLPLLSTSFSTGPRSPPSEYIEKRCRVWCQVRNRNAMRRPPELMLIYYILNK